MQKKHGVMAGLLSVFNMLLAEMETVKPIKDGVATS